MSTASDHEHEKPARMASQDRARLIAFAVIAIYVVLFVVLNTGQIKVNFVFFTAQLAVLFALLLAALLGVIAGWLLHGRLRKAKAARKAASES